MEKSAEGSTALHNTVGYKKSRSGSPRQRVSVCLRDRLNRVTTINDVTLLLKYNKK